MISAADLNKKIPLELSSELEEEIAYIESKIISWHERGSLERITGISFQNKSLSLPLKIRLVRYLQAHGYEVTYTIRNNDNDFDAFLVSWSK